MITLRGEHPSKWMPGFQEDYDELHEFTNVDERIAYLNELSDAEWSCLEDRDIKSWVDARQGYPMDQFIADVQRNIPDQPPVVPMTRRCAKGFELPDRPRYGGWPVVLCCSPYHPLAVGWRDQLAVDGRVHAPHADSYGGRPRWATPGFTRNPIFELGWWPVDGGQPLLLHSQGAHIGGGMMAEMLHYVPPRPGWLRMRVIQWQRSQRKGDKGVGEWCEPMALTHVHDWSRARSAWSDSHFADADPATIWTTRGGYRWAPAVPSDMQPFVPIEAAGDPDWTPENPPTPLDSDLGVPELPAASAPTVPEDTAEWLRKRAERYGRGRTGAHWRALQDAVAPE